MLWRSTSGEEEEKGEGESKGGGNERRTEAEVGRVKS